MARWRVGADKREKGFDTYEAADQWLNDINGRGHRLDDLRRVLWAELQERIDFRGYPRPRRRRNA